MNIVLDLGNSTIFLNGKNYKYEIIGNYLNIISDERSKWTYRIIGFCCSGNEVRFRVKEV